MPKDKKDFYFFKKKKEDLNMKNKLKQSFRYNCTVLSIIIVIPLLFGCGLSKYNQVDGNKNHLTNRKIALVEFVITPPQLSGKWSYRASIFDAGLEKSKARKISSALFELYNSRIDNFVEVFVDKSNKQGINIIKLNSLKDKLEILKNHNVNIYPKDINEVAGFNSIVIQENSLNFLDFSESSSLFDESLENNKKNENMRNLARALGVDIVLVVLVTEATHSTGAFAVRVKNYLAMKLACFDNEGSQIYFVSSTGGDVGGLMGGSPSDIQYHSNVLDSYDQLVDIVLTNF